MNSQMDLTHNEVPQYEERLSVPVMLTSNGSRGSLDENGSLRSRPILSIQTADTSTNGPNGRIPIDEPPEYIRSSRPTESILYTFSQTDANCTVLLPNATDTRPLHHIVMTFDFLNPFVVNTSLWRGGQDGGVFIGDFEMGISNQPATAMIHDEGFKIHDALKQKLHSRMWTWHPDASGMHAHIWNFDVTPATCQLLRNPESTAARFYPRPDPGQRGAPSRLPVRLEVTPDGYDALDDILMSLLIIQRKLAAPVIGDGMGQAMLNY